MFRLSFALATLVTLSPHLNAQTNPATGSAFPREVQQRYDARKAECREANGKFVGNRDSFAHKVEVTNDGLDDWVIEDAAARCTAFGHSAHCGTAGCSIEILGSAREGLTSIYNGNVRGWEIVDAGQGRKGLQLSMHGTACDTHGAEACRGVMLWNGRKWDLISKKRGLTEAERRALEAEADAYEAPEDHIANWFLGGKGANAVAAVTDHPSFVAMGVRCYPGGGLLMSAMPKENFVLPPSGQELLLSFEGYEDDVEWTQTFQPVAGTRDYDEMLPDVLRDMLAGKDATLGLLASVNGGDEWKQLDDLSLSGSSSALRALQAECGKEIVSASGSVASTTSAPNLVAFPPLPKGFYAYNTSCATAIANSRTDELAGDFAYFDETSLAQWDGGPLIKSFEALAGSRYRVRALWWGNGGDEGDPGEPGEFVIRVIGPDSFVNEDDGSRYTHCSIEAVPSAVREMFLEN